jgi:hypothetical protein
MKRSVRAGARATVLKNAGNLGRDEVVEGAPRPLSASDRRVVALTIALILLGGYVVWQVIGLATTKDAVPPSWLIKGPAGATIAGEPRIDYEPYRATTYVVVRPGDGRTTGELLAEMGLSEQPTQIGPTFLDWRPVWVYSAPASDGVELRLVYRPDTD